jgi:cell wall-associated NlpC family hydrolase
MSRAKSAGLSLLLIGVGVLTACGGSDSPSQPATYSISGSVSGAVGVSVRVSGPESRTVSSDANGFFSVPGLRPGQYTVSPTQPGFTFNPIEVAVTIADADVTSPVFTRQQPEEGLSAQDAARLDAQPDSYLAEDKVILPNGRSLSEYAKSRGITGNPAPSVSGNAARAIDPLPPAVGPQQKKNDLIAAMVLSAADYACARRSVPCTKWNYAADPADPVFKPGQTGLTYVYGGKSPLVRTRPVDGCPQLTYGMDCSGLITKVAEAAGLSAPAGSAAQANPANWTFPKEWLLTIKRVTDGSFETGDFVAWPGHIGIAESPGSGASVTVISSTGLPGDCQKNVSPPRGPRPLTIAQLGLGTPTAVLRMVTTLSGTFDMYIRCSDRSSDAAVIRFNINNDSGGPFNATGSGTDYDGSPLSFVLKGDYDQNSNIVKATLHLVDDSRIDSFTQKLLEDDTGYFPLAKVVDNGGCPGSIRLVRVSPTTPVQSITRTRSSQTPLPVPAGSLFGGRRR